MVFDNALTPKKKILFGTTVGMSANVLLRGQLKWFSRQGWDVSLVASPDSLARAAALREGVPLYPINMERSISLGKDIKSLVEWYRLLRKLRPDAVNLGTPKASLLGSIAAWLLRVEQRVYVVRGLPLEGSKGPLRLVLWLMERLTIALATDVVVVSRSLGMELVRRRLIAPSKAWLIHRGSSNGVDAAAINAQTVEIDRDALRHELGFASNSVVVGYIGRITRDKGVGTLLQAFRQEEINENLEILLIGSLEDPELLEGATELGARVHHVPWTNDPWGFLPAIDILCLPTHREGFPNVVLEAAAAGIPAITTRATGAIDSIIDGKTGYLIDIGDEVSLAERLNQLAGDPVLRKNLGNAAQNRARSSYNPEKIWQGLKAILNKDYTNKALTRLDQI